MSMIARLLVTSVCMAFASGVAGAQTTSAAGAPAEAQAEGDSAANAATPDANEGDIIVTAQKRVERLQDVPIAVTVFDADRLEASGITDVYDAVRFSPSVETFPSQGGGGTIQIRGVSTGIGGPGVDPNIAMYWDGIYVARSIIAYQDFIDVERVEILRGPQGTLYGRNATGGAINVIRKRPTNEFSGEIRADYGSLNKRGLAGALNVPLGDALAVRAFVSRQSEDNYGINLINDERLKRLDSLAGGVAVAIRPSDDLEVILRADAEKDDGLGVVSLHVTRPGDYTLDADLPDDPFEFRNDFVQNDNLLKHHGFSGEINWDLNGYQLRSLTGYRMIDTNLLWDGDATEIASSFFKQRDMSKAWSQEFQLISPKIGSFDFIAGLYYFHENADIVTSNGGPTNYELFSGLIDNATNQFIYIDVPYSNRGYYEAYNETDAYAAFAEFRYDLSPKLRATFGLRYNHENRTFNGEVRRQFIPTTGTIDDEPFDLIAACNAAAAGARHYNSAIDPNTSPADYCASPNPSGGAFTNLRTLFDYYATFDAGVVRPEQKFEEDVLTPRFLLEYRPQGDLLLYASATKGYKSGGFNTYDTNPIIVDANDDGIVDENDAGIIPFQDPFGGEHLWSYEAGMKWTLPGNSLFLNVNGFFYDYSNIQVQVFNSADRTNFVTNGAKADVYGIEVDLQYRPTPMTLIDFAGAWIEGKYTHFDQLIVDAVTDEELDPTGLGIAGQPRWKWNLGAQHTVPLAGNRLGSLTLRGEWAHRSESQYYLSLSEETIGGDYDLFNARLTYTSPNGAFDISAYVQNVTDETYEYFVSGSTLFGRILLLGPPRQAGVTLSARF